MDKLKLDILFLLKPAQPYGLGVDTILRDLRVGRSRSLTLPELETAIRELADASLVTTVKSTLSGTKWRITAVGESALQEEGL